MSANVGPNYVKFFGTPPTGGSALVTAAAVNCGAKLVTESREVIFS
jgi:hypothetical protein